MDRSEKRRSKRLKPISAWGYVGYSILYAIPIIGLVFLLIFTFAGGNVNRRNYARSYWCKLLVGLVLTLIFVIVLFSLGRENVDRYVSDLRIQLYQQFPILQEWTGKQPESTSVPEIQATEAPDAGASTPVPAADGASTGGVSPEFKEAMDSYEAFYDKYIETFTAFTNDPGDQDVLASYMSMVSQAQDMSAKIDAIDETTLSDADYAYYAEVMARIDAKLIQAGAQR